MPTTQKLSTWVYLLSLIGLFTLNACKHNIKHNTSMTVKEITVHELKALQDANQDFQLIDVREPAEYEEANLGGQLIPLGTVVNHAGEIATDKQVIVHCRSGKRSEMAVKQLQNAHGFDNLYNLKGGIIAYAREIDSTLQVQ